MHKIQNDFKLVSEKTVGLSSHFCVLYYMKCNQIPGLATFVTFYFLSSSDSNSPQVVKKPPVNSSEEWSTKRTCDDTVSTISSLHSSPTVSPQGSPRKGLQPKPFLASFFFFTLFAFYPLQIILLI